MTLWIGGEFIGAAGQPSSCIARWETEAFGTAAEDEEIMPASLDLEAYPNPSSGAITVRFRLDAPGPVRLSVYDLLGRKVAVLTDAVQTSGTHEVQLGVAGLAAGVYLVRLERGIGTSTEVLTRRVTLLE